MDTVVALGHLATALAIGLLLGVEREHDNAHDSTRPAGSRTFPLIALAGAVSAALSPVALGVALAAVAALVIAWYVRTSEPGATTEIAAIATFLLGALAWQRPELAVPVGVAAAALLAAKRPLHRFARKVVSDQDVRDAMILFVVAFVVLPLLPNRPLGPYGVLNPARVWWLVIAVTVIGWAGYVAARAFGERWGLLVTGFAGGFVSGSATTAVMARKYRTVGAAVFPGAVAVNLATLAQIVAVTAIASPPVALRLLPAIGAGAVVLLAEVTWLVWRTKPAEPQNDEPVVSRPMSLKAALSLAAVLVLFLVVTRAAADWLGGGGVVAAGALGGMADAHAAAIAAASLAPQSISVRIAVLACGAALATNTVVKLVLATVAGGPRFALQLAAWLAPVVVAVGLGMAW
ncbi:MgtC/SapB family protein [Lentzea sp. NPDC092896]|uniref:MgtC/SapB family protein n=1 Tax=Lentzea sp. NPDC092896 TaxID=3364127 RepID=UPI0037F8707E